MKILTQSLIVSLTIALLAMSATGAQPTDFVTIAGSPGSPGFANGTNGTARFHFPQGIAEDSHGNLYVVDNNESVIRKLTPDGTNWVVTTIAGMPGGNVDIDGTNGAASFDDPVGIAVDASGNLYVGENFGSTIRKITPEGTNWVVTTIAGQPENFDWADGTNQDALFNGPQNLTVDSQGNLYVADSYNYVIRKVTPVGTNWVVTTIAGQPGIQGYADGTNNSASFSFPYGVTLDGAGNLYVADSVYSTIRKVTPVGTNWVVTTIAGSPGGGGNSDGTNSAAQFNQPLGIAVDSAGNLFVADKGNGSIRRITPIGTNWVVSTISGAGAFSQPWGATLDSSGRLFVTDSDNQTVLMGLVELPPPPTAAFSGTPTNGPAPLTVTFANLSSGATNYVWDFGDGRILSTSSNTNVTETYTNTGAYTVVLTASGPGGVNAATNKDYIVVASQTTNVPNPTFALNLVQQTITVSWPANGGYVLQTNYDLTQPWADYGGQVSTSNGTNSVTFPLSPDGPSFFRLTVGTVPPPTVPNLVIAVASTNLVVSWPATGSYTLQTNADLTTTNWGDYGGTINSGGGTNSAAFTPSPGSLFFRLKQ